MSGWCSLMACSSSRAYCSIRSCTILLPPEQPLSATVALLEPPPCRLQGVAYQRPGVGDGLHQGHLVLVARPWVPGSRKRWAASSSPSARSRCSRSRSRVMLWRSSTCLSSENPAPPRPFYGLPNQLLARLYQRLRNPSGELLLQRCCALRGLGGLLTRGF